MNEPGAKNVYNLGHWVVVKEDSLSISAQGASTALRKGIFLVQPLIKNIYQPNCPFLSLDIVCQTLLTSYVIIEVGIDQE